MRCLFFFLPLPLSHVNTVFMVFWTRARGIFLAVCSICTECCVEPSTNPTKETRGESCFLKIGNRQKSLRYFCVATPITKGSIVSEDALLVLGLRTRTVHPQSCRCFLCWMAELSERGLKRHLPLSQAVVVGHLLMRQPGDLLHLLGPSRPCLLWPASLLWLPFPLWQLPCQALAMLFEFVKTNTRNLG